MPKNLPDDPAEKRAEPTIDEICLSNPKFPTVDTHPSVPAIYTAAVYQCESTEVADQILGGSVPGFAYQRDAHPNATRLAEKCRQLHSAEAAAITSSGMSALSAITLGNLQAGDHILVSNQLYGRSSVLLEQWTRFGIAVDSFDPNDLDQIEKKHQLGKTRMVFAETISNPVIRIVDIPELVRLGARLDFQVAIDNTFATPFLCKPLALGADWVWESYSKMLNGHSDLMMGLVCGRHKNWKPVEKAISTWGLSSAPFECYLAERGLTTFGLRIRACIENAMKAADFLCRHRNVEKVYYPGLRNHPDRAKVDSVLNANRLENDDFQSCEIESNDRNGEPTPSAQLPGRKMVAAAGNVVTIELKGQTSLEQIHSNAVASFLASSGIEYYPSLGECNTTLSHPCSSSHRHLSPQQRQTLGISADTIRLCFGIEPWKVVRQKLSLGLEAIESSSDSSSESSSQ